MEVQAIQGYFDDGKFYQQGKSVALPERQMVIVNVLNIPADTNVREPRKEPKEFWAEFKRMLKESADGVLCIDDFPRTNISREMLPLIEDGEQP